MPVIKYSIRVVDENGEAISRRAVSVHYDLSIDEDYTDDEGWVKFKKDNVLEPSARATVYINGDNVGEIIAHDGDTFSFEVD